MIGQLYRAYRDRGVVGLFSWVLHYIDPKAPLRDAGILELISGRVGLEVGGPSRMFSRGGLFPVYEVVGRVDNCTFARNTIWEGVVVEGDTFHFAAGRTPGRQYVTEATDLSCIASASYDFVLSSHCLEHVANPLRALGEWIRVLKPGGLLLIILPNKDGIFDHRRPVTPFTHLLDDLHSGIGEDDLAHLPEILSLHDLAMDPGAGNFEAFRARSMRNFENRGLHHHTFDAPLAAQIADNLELETLSLTLRGPDNICLVAQKPLRYAKQPRTAA
jgi:SAM-dependent methyltransferase